MWPAAIEDRGYSPDNDVNREPWDLDDALETIRAVESLVRPIGLFTSLTGGVLYRGESKKDLDIVICQLSGEARDFPEAEMRAALRSLKWELYWDYAAVRKYREAQGEPNGCTKAHVECWLAPGNRRVDVFLKRDPR